MLFVIVKIALELCTTLKSKCNMGKHHRQDFGVEIHIEYVHSIVCGYIFTLNSLF